MTLYELLKTLHLLAIATWFGSGVALTVIGLRALKTDVAAFSSFTMNAGWWAGRAHPAAGLVLLLTGFGMVGDAGLSIGTTWVLIGLIGLVVTMGVGGALVGRASNELMKGLEGSGGSLTAELRPTADRLLIFTRVESALLLVLIADMVIKPG